MGWAISKCKCGHPSCNQFTLSNQGSVGFEEADARLMAASPDLLDAAKEGRTDLMLIADNARDAAKTDPRWDGVAEKLMARVKMMDAAIAKARAGQ